jgi:sulfur carrier protein
MSIQATPIEVTINGRSHRFAAQATLADVIRELKLGPRAVAVEVNRQLIPRQRHGEHRIRAGDELEIVSLAGGG